jgi:hypothetical protein
MMLVRDRFSILGLVVLACAALITTVLVVSRPTPGPAVAEADPAPAEADVTTPVVTTPPPSSGPAGSEVTIAIQLDGLAGARSFARPGDHVDLVAFLPADLVGQPEARVLVRDVLVADSASPATTNDAVLAIRASRDQVALIVAAERLGARPFAVLRPAVDLGRSEEPEHVSDADVGLRVAQLFAPTPG